jgi:molecular chaperone GrpE
VEELLDKLKRARADLANFQRRVERERESWAESGRRQVLSGILPTLDDLELAVQASGEHPDPEKLRTAVMLIRDELLKHLTSQGVSPIKASGETFDPEYHEALYSIPADGVEPGVVVEELRKGYRLGEKVLRPSQVAVSAPPPGAGAAGEPQDAAAPADAEGDAGSGGADTDDGEGK